MSGSELLPQALFEALKTCSKCRETKPDTAFHQNGEGGRRSKCRDCRAKTEKRRPRTALERRGPDLLRKYGITVEQYDAMHDAQGGRCAICGDVPAAGLALDHCHNTGKPRGLLCKLCNLGIGHFRDRADLLTAAAAYLSHHAPTA
ncbi:endonuclease VII domain-containing protein [[Kitasatospora] papulosa]|uniref:endonuclease VII domain-containing protein n=1 Tax=[Kitasatospora] papulosa TaxID=1464011 RepID=UPI0036A988DB